MHNLEVGGSTNLGQNAYGKRGQVLRIIGLAVAHEEKLD
jgi:hypothetical protein